MKVFVDNRAYLKDEEIICNIDFYKESDKQSQVYGIKDFEVAKDLISVTCPNGVTTENYTIVNRENGKDKLAFKFTKKTCMECSLKDQCMRKTKTKKGESYVVKTVEIYVRHDAVLHDLERVETAAFKEALNKRCKVERRFATMVRNHGLRRCRYLRLKGAMIHINLANTVCNVIRMVKLLMPSQGVITS